MMPTQHYALSNITTVNRYKETHTLWHSINYSPIIYLPELRRVQSCKLTNNSTGEFLYTLEYYIKTGRNTFVCHVWEFSEALTRTYVQCFFQWGEACAREIETFVQGIEQSWPHLDEETQLELDWAFWIYADEYLQVAESFCTPDCMERIRRAIGIVKQLTAA